ncbi:MAG: tannase/feruloyl esterase family alpha/beta hydrolase, partial [Gammaproteobacteria bacterium]|nr:tannase/feruloyl esterase family alpha/beta hydrolase [Gammaproteobacteria bacterium]
FLLWVPMAHRAQEANPLSEAHLTLLGKASRQACDTLDGFEDGVVNDPRLCTKELSTVPRGETQAR